MDKNYFVWFLDEFNYPEEAKCELLFVFDKIKSEKEFFNAFQNIVKRYIIDINADVYVMIKDVKELAVKNKLNIYTITLIMLIVMSEYLRERYIQKNISLDIWKNSMNDLLYKCLECRLIYGVWGVFAEWFMCFYNLTRFALGKLQFEMSNSPIDFESKKIHLNKGDKLLRVHIPRTGTRLYREDQINAYKQAVDFFKPFFGNDKIYFTCESWLLFPPVKEMLSPSSNLFAFVNDFEIMEQGFYDDFFSWAWRLFDTGEKDIDKLPVNTSLRKNYVEYIKSGNKSGWGYGIFEFKI